MAIKNKKLKKGDIYAVHTGTFAGELLIFIKEQNNDFCFLAVPTMINRRVPKLSFEHGRNSNIIKFVESAPRYVYKTSVAQYVKNENSNNRYKQSNTPHLLDGQEAARESPE